MKNVWWWIVLVAVLAIGVVFWYTQRTSTNVLPATATKQTRLLPTTAGTLQASASDIVARDDSDTSLDADMNDINTQMAYLDVDSQDAQ